MGQVAPEISRRQQEYMGVGGRSVTGPVISPWMLPPTSGTGTTSSNATSLSDAPPPSSSLLNWDNDARPPQHAARSQVRLSRCPGHSLLFSYIHRMSSFCTGWSRWWSRDPTIRDDR